MYKSNENIYMRTEESLSQPVIESDDPTAALISRLCLIRKIAPGCIAPNGVRGDEVTPL